MKKEIFIVVLFLIPAAYAIDESICYAEDPVPVLQACIDNSANIASFDSQITTIQNDITQLEQTKKQEYDACVPNYAVGMTNPENNEPIKTDDQSDALQIKYCAPINFNYQDQIDAKEDELEETRDRKMIAICDECYLDYCEYRIFKSDCYYMEKNCDEARNAVMGAPFPDSRKENPGCPNIGQQGPLDTNQGNQQDTKKDNTLDNLKTIHQTITNSIDELKNKKKPAPKKVEELKKTKKAQERKDEIDDLIAEIDKLIEEEEKKEVSFADKKSMSAILGTSNVVESELAKKVQKKPEKLRIEMKDQALYIVRKEGKKQMENFIDNIPLVKYFKKNIMNVVDDATLSDKDKVKQNAIENNYDVYAGRADSRVDKSTENKLAAPKSFIEDVGGTLVKPFSWTLDKMGSFFSKERAESGGEAYKQVEKNVKDYMGMGLSKKEAISAAKRDWVEMDVHKGLHGAGRNTGMWSKGQKESPGKMFDNMVEDLQKDGHLQ